MVEKSSYISSSKKSFFLKIVFVVALVFIMERALDYYLEKKNGNPSFRLGEKMLAEIRGMQQPSVDILFVGDSSCNAAIDVKTVEKETGLVTAKFAPPARYGQMSGYYFLKEYLQNHSPPKYLVDIRTPSLMGQRWSPELFFDDFFNIPDCIGLLMADVITIDELFLIHVPNMLNSYRNRFAIKRLLGEETGLLRFATIHSLPEREQMGKAAKGRGKRKYKKPFCRVGKTYIFKEDAKYINNGIEKSLKHYNDGSSGALLSEKNIEIKIGERVYTLQDRVDANGLKPMQVTDAYRRRLGSFAKKLEYNGVKPFSGVDHYYLEKTLKLCAEHDIQYLFYSGPLLDALYEHFLGKTFFDQAMQQVKGLQGIYYNFNLLSDSTPLFSFEFLTNSTEHLNKKGRDLYSKDFAKIFSDKFEN